MQENAIGCSGPYHFKGKVSSRAKSKNDLILIGRLFIWLFLAPPSGEPGGENTEYLIEGYEMKLKISKAHVVCAMES